MVLVALVVIVFLGTAAAIGGLAWYALSGITKASRWGS